MHYAPVLANAKLVVFGGPRYGEQGEKISTQTKYRNQDTSRRDELIVTKVVLLKSASNDLWTLIG